MTYILVKRKTKQKQAEKGKKEKKTRACSDLGGVMEDVME